MRMAESNGEKRIRGTKTEKQERQHESKEAADKAIAQPVT